MIRVYLASFLQPENFGPGRVFSVTDGTKPSTMKSLQKFQYFIPDSKILERYYETKKINQNQASEVFILQFKNQLNDFVEKVLAEAVIENTEPCTLLPFKSGDTLCSWERKQFYNYREWIGQALEKLGYEVVVN